MEIFWMITGALGGIIIGISGIWVVIFAPMILIKRMAKLRNLPKPEGWILACVILTWYTPILYYIFVGRKTNKVLPLFNDKNVKIDQTETL